MYKIVSFPFVLMYIEHIVYSLAFAIVAVMLLKPTGGWMVYAHRRRKRVHTRYRRYF